jgi:hypothetical protein
VARKGKTPIALFSYNRPKHIGLALESLVRCSRFNECGLHIYCDGPKDPTQHSAVEASREVVREWQRRLGCEMIERRENLGLAGSIVSGVSDLCAEYGRVIVLEDDLVVAPDFLDYMLQALDKYRDRSEVYQISGYMFPVVHPPKPDAFLLPLTTTWGWATWDRAWRIFDWSAPGHTCAFGDPMIRRAFDLDDSYPYTELLRQRLSGQNDSWGILWWWSVFQAGGMVLHPRQSLVWVGGFDGSGTHCGELPETLAASSMDIDHEVLTNPMVFPSDLSADNAAFDRIKTHLRSLKTITLKSKVEDALRRLRAVAFTRNCRGQS